MNGSGSAIAYANPLLSSPAFGIGFLNGPEGEPYPNSVTVSGSDRIDTRPSHGDDAAALQADPDVADRTYAQARYDDGIWWLQYWSYYYYDWGSFVGHIGEHEGDWEMIQIGLDQYGAPTYGTYAAHGGAYQTCDWPALDWTLGYYANVSPYVYVAKNKHASYVRPGSLIGPTSTDVADGEGHESRLRVSAMGSLAWRTGQAHGATRVRAALRARFTNPRMRGSIPPGSQQTEAVANRRRRAAARPAAPELGPTSLRSRTSPASSANVPW